MRRLLIRPFGAATGILLAAGVMSQGAVLALQRSGGGGNASQTLGSASTSSTSVGGRSGSLYNTPDAPFEGVGRDAMEEKRSKLVISERQRLMAKEADQIVQDAAELNASVSGGSDASREELFKRADAIEKLARNVKERMKGAR